MKDDFLKNGHPSAAWDLLVTEPHFHVLNMLKSPPSATFSFPTAFNTLYPFNTRKAMLTILITSGIVMLIRRLRGTK